ncbi:MAG: hypothetical protein AAF628_31075 [Planctomycetota bacterium]
MGHYLFVELRGPGGLGRRALHDAALQGIPSHTLLVPEGFVVEAAPEWTPQNPTSFVNLRGRVRGPAASELCFFPQRAFMFTDDVNVQQRMGLQVGARTPLGSLVWAPPRGPGEVVVQVVMPEFRPQVSDLRVLDARQVDDVTRPLERLVQPMLADDRHANGMAAMSGVGANSSTWMVGERVRVAYREAGVEWEEEFTLAMYGRTIHLGGQGWVPASNHSDWQLLAFRSVRAPRGQLDAALPLLTCMAASVRETPEWFTQVRRTKREVDRIRSQGAQACLQIIRESGRRTQQILSEISDMQRQSWREHEAITDRANRAFTNAIRGVEDYSMPGGGTVSLDSRFAHVFTDGFDRFILTNDGLYNPNSDDAVNQHQWQSIAPVTPAGEAANGW